MSHPIQSQLFPENFLYVVAPEQTNTFKKELKVNHLGPKNRKKEFFVSKWSEKNNINIFFECILVFFEVLGNLVIWYHDEQ